MKKNFLALWVALCLLVSAFPMEALSEADLVQAQNVDAEVRELGWDDDAPDLDDLADLEDTVAPEDQDVVMEMDGLELSDICDDPASGQDGATGAIGAIGATDAIGAAGAEKAPAAATAPTGDAVTKGAVTAVAEGISAASSEAPAEAPDENPEESADSITVQDTIVKPAENTEDKPAQDAIVKATESAENKPAQDISDKPAEKTEDEPVQDISEKPAEKTEDEPVQDAPEKQQDVAEDEGQAEPAVTAEDAGDAKEPDGEAGEAENQQPGEDAEGAQTPDETPEDGEEEEGESSEPSEAGEAQDKADAESDKTEEKTDEITDEKVEEKTEEKADDKADDKADGNAEAATTGEGQEASEGDGQAEAGEEDPSNPLLEPSSTLTLDQAAATVPVQGTVTLKASGGTGAITWTSENAAAATVDAQGVVTAVAVGAARIVAKDENGAQAACDVTVIEVPPDVAFEAAELQLGLRETRRLPRLIWAGGAKVYQGTVSYASSDAKIVTVTADGQVSAIAKGSAQIVATFPDGKALQCAVTVKNAPKKVTLKPKKRSMSVGESLQLTYTLPAGSAGGVTWSSSNPAVVAVDAGTGLAIAQCPGTAKITAVTYNKKRATVTVTVFAVPTPVVTVVPGKVLRIGKGDRVRVQTAAGDADPVTGCTSRNKKVVRAEGGGFLYGVKTGSANVTVRTAGGSMRVKVVVRRAPRSISASPNPLNLGVGETYTLSYKTSAGSAGSVLFTGDAPSVFSVNEATGQITGIAPGSGTVTLVSFNGKTATCPVTVHAAPTSVEFDPAQTSVGKKQKLQLQMKFNAGAWSNITYEVDNPKVAKVSADGVITGVSVGQTVLRAKTFVPGLYAETVFTVFGPPSKVWLEQKAMTVSVGQVFRIEPKIPAGSQTTFTFKSSRKSVATVGADGTVTPLKKGTTKITITTHNKKKTTLKLTVKNTGTVDPGTSQTGTLCLTIPARTTGIDGIAGNLAMINDIKNSTLGEINRLQSAGTLSAESAARRREIVESIFANYAFPWMTPSLQKYWKAANSENGAKDFKPDVVYYGMPYISGSGANRRYSAALAVAEGRYTDSGLGYYVLNKSNYLNGKYVGNDCSGLVNVSIWGTNSSHSADRTDDINKTSAYKTISDYGAMLPGDLICKSNAHVIMFLYYANEDKSSFMMIENGGSEAGTNTVHCDIKTVAGFKKSGYKVRRLAGL